MKVLYKSIVVAMAVLATYAQASDERVVNITHISTEQKQAELAKFDSLNQLGELTLTLPKPVYFTTTNGVEAMFTPMHNLPIVDIALEFAVGTKHDEFIKKDAEGIATLTASLMTSGTKTLDEEAFKEKTDELAMALSVGAGSETYRVGLRSLLIDETLDESVAIMLDAINNPSFDQKVFERLKAQLLIADRMARQDPSYLASQAFSAIIEKDDPKAYDDIAKALARIEREDLVAYQERFLVAENAKLAITGDLSFESAKALAERIATALPKGQKAPEFLPVKTPKPRHYHITHPSTQTVVLMGNITPVPAKSKVGTQEVHDYTIGNNVLAGGDFNSRLMKEIRVKNGYTYGIGGGLNYDSQRGLYRIGFSAETAKAPDAIHKTFEVIKDTLATGITQDEMSDEKSGMKNAYPARFATHAGVHGAVSTVFFDDLPKDHLETRFERLDNATLESVKTALNKYILPNEFIVVTVGATKPKIVLPKDKKSTK